MIRFIGNDEAGLPLKRKQLRKACNNCRKRKKRCIHQFHLREQGSNTHDANARSPCQTLTDGGRLSQRPAGAMPGRISLSTSTLADEQQSLKIANQSLPIPPSPARDHCDVVDAEDEEHRNPRFVGELNPESTFVAGVSPGGASRVTVGMSPEGAVGVWVPRKLVHSGPSSEEPILHFLVPYLEERCSCALPTPSHYAAIYQLYEDEFHPIWPIVNLEAYRNMPRKQKALMELAICLCVSSNSKANKHLGASPRDFVAHVTQLLRSCIDHGLVRDKQVIIQLLAILAFCTQLCDDRHASAEFACRAISYVHTGGLHLDTSARKGETPYTTRLFCCVYALDRLNAAVQGRPVLMHERDFGRSFVTCVGQQDGPFQLLLRVTMLLDKVIALYRPTQDGSSVGTAGEKDFELAFPSFEEVINECGNLRADGALIATIECLYHAVAMLSCRSQTLHQEDRSSASRFRQSLSASNLISTVGVEYRDQLSVLPFVPYAVSLALRVCYTDLRCSKSSFTRARARKQVLRICELLRELGSTFPSSLHMVELAEQLIHEMDKTYSAFMSQIRANTVNGTFYSRPLDPQRPQCSDPESIEQLPTRRASEQAGQIPNENVSQGYGNESMSLNTASSGLEFDIFDHLDPDFDIGAIDAELANTFDPFCLFGQDSFITE